MNKKKYFLFCFLLGVTAFCFARQETALQTKNKKHNLWDYASPSADVIVYINTMQAEKSMDTRLWQRIEKDKNKALDEDKEDSLFDVKGRDMEAVVNVMLSSFVPFKGMIEGVASISGDVNAEIQKLLNPKEGTDLPAPTIAKKGDLKFYQYDFKAEDGISPANVTFSLDKDGLLHYRVLIGAEGDKIPVALSGANTSGVQTLVSGMQNDDLSFAFVLKTAKLSWLPIPQEEEKAKKLKDFLGKVSVVSATGRVLGRNLKLKIVFRCKNNMIANEMCKTTQDFLEQITKGFGKQIKQLKVSIKKSDVAVTGDVDIAVAWNLISGITQHSHNAEEGADEATDDEDGKERK